MEKALTSIVVNAWQRSRPLFCLLYWRPKRQHNLLRWFRPGVFSIKRFNLLNVLFFMILKKTPVFQQREFEHTGMCTDNFKHWKSECLKENKVNFQWEVEIQYKKLTAWATCAACSSNSRGGAIGPKILCLGSSMHPITPKSSSSPELSRPSLSKCALPPLSFISWSICSSSLIFFVCPTIQDRF